MGAWGHGYFEDDAAFDFMDKIEKAYNPKQIIADALDTAIDAAYLETDEGNAVIVSATYIDRQLNGTKFTSSERKEPLGVDTFPNRHPDVNLSDLREKAVHALQKLLSDNSELKELWEDTEEDYSAWREGLNVLIQRLNHD